MTTWKLIQLLTQFDPDTQVQIEFRFPRKDNLIIPVSDVYASPRGPCLVARSNEAPSSILIPNPPPNLISNAHPKSAPMPDTLVLDRLLTANEVARMAGIHIETLYKWTRTGRIPCKKLRHRLRFSKADIERWLKQHTTGRF